MSQCEQCGSAENIREIQGHHLCAECRSMVDEIMKEWHQILMNNMAAGKRLDELTYTDIMKRVMEARARRWMKER